MSEERLEIIEIDGNDSMRVIVQKLNRMLSVVQKGVAVKFVERFDAALGQQAFELPTPYILGTNYLTAYVNGVKQRANIDYEETDETTVTFYEPLLDDDVVEFEWFAPNGEVLLGKIDFSEVHQLPDGSIPYSKLDLPNEIITGDIDGGMFTDPRFQAGIDGGNFGPDSENSIDGGAL